jgi:hypothetical protein
MVLLVLCAAPPAFASTESSPITVHDCVDIEFVFARGSGQAVNEGAE